MTRAARRRTVEADHNRGCRPSSRPSRGEHWPMSPPRLAGQSSPSSPHNPPSSCSGQLGAAPSKGCGFCARCPGQPGVGNEGSPGAKGGDTVQKRGGIAPLTTVSRSAFPTFRETAPHPSFCDTPRRTPPRRRCCSFPRSPRECRVRRSASSAQAIGRWSVPDGIPTRSVGTRFCPRLVRDRADNPVVLSEESPFCLTSRFLPWFVPPISFLTPRFLAEICRRLSSAPRVVGAISGGSS